MSFIDNTAPNAPIGIPDEDIIVEFDEHPPIEMLDPALTEGLDIEMTEDGGAIIDFDPSTEAEIPPDLPHGANLAEFIDDDTLKSLALELSGLYDEDKETRSDWMQKFNSGLDELGFKTTERSEPFDGASGVFHPLLAEAATQFQSQAYKELLPPGGPVSVSTIGSAPKPEDPNAPSADLIERAARVKEFMNYQITNVMEEFDPELDQMLFYLSLSGSSFKKVYFDQALGRAVSKFITAEDLVVNYNATDLQSAERVTHIIRMSENELKKHQVFGFYRDIDLGSAGDPELNPIEEKIDELNGMTRTGYGSDQYSILEMHVNLDIPNFEDIHPETGEPSGIALPYIVSINYDTSDILGIRRNFGEGDTSLKRKDYFIHYKFLPGLGFYGFGLIHMIGGLASTATSILRQLIDAGTFSNLPGGFKARGTRIEGGDSPVNPGEWKDVDTPGGNIGQIFMPLPYKEPSNVLLQLLGLVIDSGRRFASIADTTISESGSQQNPVGTTMALIERGSKVMSAIHKRLHYAQRKEFKLLSDVFAEYLPPEYPYSIGGVQKAVKQEDFGPEVDVIPVSDPNIFSAAQRVSLAQQQLAMAQAAPEVHNLKEAYRRMYIALEVKNIEDILPKDLQPQPKSPAMEHADVVKGMMLTAFPDQDHMTHIQAHIQFAQVSIVAMNPPFVGALTADIMAHISFIAQAEAQKQVQQIQQQQMQQAALQMQAQGVHPQQIQAQMQQLPQIPPQEIAKLSEQIELKLMTDIIPQIAPTPVDPMKEMHDNEMQVKSQGDMLKAQDAERKTMVDVEKAKEQEETKRLGIQVQQATANQDTAQRREAAHLNAKVQSDGINQRAMAEAEKNDISRRSNFSQGRV
jgi:hypothetical protein